MSITLPQAIMMNHAAWVSRKNTERKFEARREREKKGQGSIISKPHEKAEAEYVQKLDEQSLSNYMRSGWE